MQPTLGSFVRSRRRSLKKSISALSLEAGLGYFQLYALERGRAQGVPEPAILQRLADALAVPVHELLRAAGYPVGGELEAADAK